MSCQQVPTTPALKPYPRSVQVGEFEVAISGGVWVAIRVWTNNFKCGTFGSDNNLSDFNLVAQLELPTRSVSRNDPSLSLQGGNDHAFFGGDLLGSHETPGFSRLTHRMYRELPRSAIVLEYRSCKTSLSRLATNAVDLEG